MYSHEVFIHMHQGCFAGTAAIVRLPQYQWSKSDGYGKISQCITTTKHSKAKSVCIFLGIYCISMEVYTSELLPLLECITLKIVCMMAIRTRHVICLGIYEGYNGDSVTNAPTERKHYMMASSIGNVFHVTGHLCGEFTGPWWIPRIKASDAELWCFFDLRLNERLSKQSWGWWFETPSRPLWRHSNDTLCKASCLRLLNIQRVLIFMSFILAEIPSRLKSLPGT